MVKNYLLKVSGLLLITLFITVACTNDETNDFIENYSAIQQSKKANVRTRSISYQTWEEVDSRLAEINAKYGVEWKINKKMPIENFDEGYFEYLEYVIQTKILGLKPINNSTYDIRLDDSSINEITVASTGKTSGEGGNNSEDLVEEIIDKEIEQTLSIDDIYQMYIQQNDTIIFHNHKIDLKFHQYGKQNTTSHSHITTKLVEGPIDRTNYPQALVNRKMTIGECEIFPNHYGTTDGKGYLSFRYNLNITIDSTAHLLICNSEGYLSNMKE